MINLLTDYLDAAEKGNSDKVAVVEEKKTVTYRELRYRSLQVAVHIKKFNIEKSPIAICMKRGADAIIAMFGVMYSSNFYTNIDVKAPSERIDKIIFDFDPEIIITDDIEIFSNCTNSKKCRIVEYEKIIDSKIVDKRLDIKPITKSNDLLCVIYTSGSTGTPKGVAIPHQAVINYIEDATRCYCNMSSDDILGNQYPFHYVASIDDIFLSIRNKACIVIIPDRLFFSPVGLIDYLIEKNVNVINWVPSALTIVERYDALKGRDVNNIKKVIFGGEIMSIKTLNYWRKAIPDAVFINGYGATETVEGTTYYIVDREFDIDETLPLGKPLDGVELIIYGDHNDRNEGELYVRSRYISYGYYKDLDRTDQVFVQNPLHNKYKDIVYKTGDIVKRGTNGDLIYMGRYDLQIKRSGHRINLIEIEENAALLTENACVYDEVSKHILLFYTKDISEAEVVEYLKKKLPSYMMPDRFIHISDIPRKSNGKIDRNKLMKR